MSEDIHDIVNVSVVVYQQLITHINYRLVFAILHLMIMHTSITISDIIHLGLETGELSFFILFVGPPGVSLSRI